MTTFKRHQSWGRTRSPKNLTGTNGDPVAVYANAVPLKGVTAPAIAEPGYNTENQRFLHVLLEDSHTVDNPTNNLLIFGYCHAFERWFEIPETHYTVVANTAATATSIDVADSGRALAAQVPSDREYRLYEIVGIDKVAFVNADPTEVNVYAACSTF
mgnify:CR=1 FL=1|jgi:hypothetical protein